MIVRTFRVDFMTLMVKSTVLGLLVIIGGMIHNPVVTNIELAYLTIQVLSVIPTTGLRMRVFLCVV